MANFPQWNYQQQQAGGYGQQMMQPVYQMPAYQAMQQPQGMQQEQPLQCRMVTSEEEARGVPVDFSGRPMTFLNLPRGTIYVKAFNPGTGAAEFAEYRRVDAAENTQAAEKRYVTAEELEEVLRTIREQGEEIAALRGQTRRRSTREGENE